MWHGVTLVKLQVTAANRALNDIKLKAGQEQANGPTAMAAHRQLLIAFCTALAAFPLAPGLSGVCPGVARYTRLQLLHVAAFWGSAMPMPTSIAVTAARSARKVIDENYKNCVPHKTN